MIVAGLDPSLQNFGMVKGTIVNDSSFTLSQIHLTETKPNKKTKTVRNNSIDLERAKTIVADLTAFIADVDLVFAEVPIGSQSARSMASYGICIGVLAGIQKPLIQVTPTEVKLAATKNKNATKQQMIDWATDMYPDADWFSRRVHGIKTFTNKNEHVADALGAIFAGARTDTFQQLLAFRKHIA